MFKHSNAGCAGGGGSGGAQTQISAHHRAKPDYGAISTILGFETKSTKAPPVTHKIPPQPPGRF